MAKETCILEMKQISKSFEGKEVLKDISLKVNEGEVVSIIGDRVPENRHCCAARHFWSRLTAAILHTVGKPS